MSIKPLDFQVSVPRTVEISKFKNDQIQKDLSLHQSQTLKMQTKSDAKTKLVEKKENPEKVGMRKRQEEGQQQQQQKQGKNSRNNIKEHSTKDRENNTACTGKIDIRL